MADIQEWMYAFDQMSHYLNDNTVFSRKTTIERDERRRKRNILSLLVLCPGLHGLAVLMGDHTGVV
jgi:hypothetical protein